MKWRRLLFPPAWVTALLTCGSGAGLILVFVKGWEETIPAYALYGLSAYALTVVCAAWAVRAPGWSRSLQARAALIPEKARRELPLVVSLGMNVLFVLVNAAAWMQQGSSWYAVLAGYYGILTFVRLTLARGLHASVRDQWKRVACCSVILLLLNFSLSAEVLMVLYVGRGFAYEGVLVYAMALYTFYSTIHAAMGLAKRRQYDRPVETAAQAISLSAALVSMLALETAMLAQFGAETSAEAKYLLVVLTGAGVSLIVISMAVWMLRKARRALKN